MYSLETEQAFEDCSVLTNMCVQHHNLNLMLSFIEHYSRKRISKAYRKWSVKTHKHLPLIRFGLVLTNVIKIKRQTPQQRHNPVVQMPTPVFLFIISCHQCLVGNKLTKKKKNNATDRRLFYMRDLFVFATYPSILKHQ